MLESRRIVHIGRGAESLTLLFARLVREGAEVAAGLRAEEALRRIERGGVDLLLVEGGCEEDDPFDAAERALRMDPLLSVVVAAHAPSFSEAVRLGQLGVAEYVPLDSPIEWLLERVELILIERPRWRRTECGAAFAPLVGASPAMERVTMLGAMIAPRQSTVLLMGETGTGKEVLARAIHQASRRAKGPMVAVNCGAIPADLIESELFGHVRGAFTGATSSREGKFELADGGTIFLDEVGETPPAMQAKLLRALQERAFERVGGSETIRVDVRVIAATNRDLREMVRQRRFREDLYYRLNVVPIELPTLAERIEDLPALAAHLIAKICRREKLSAKRCSPETLDCLVRHDWPGNVRELENAIEHAVALSADREILYPSDFSLPGRALDRADAPGLRVPTGGLDYDAVVAGFELNLMRQALEIADGNKKRAADLLRLKRTTFNARLKTIEDASGATA
jgi:DNA-binding NtrC family response regulator